MRHVLAAPHQERAVQAFRQAGEAERAGVAHMRLQEIQRGVADEQRKFPPLSAPLISGFYKKACEAGVELVRGYNWNEALRRLAFALPITRRADRENSVLEAQKKYIFSQLFSEDRKHNAEGKLIARAGTIEAKMFQEEARHMSWISDGLLRPAIDHIRYEHDVRFHEVYSLLLNRLWIPPGQTHSYARGLLAGLRQDWTLAVHLLIPQIEHSVRYMLAQLKGKSRSSIDERGVQKEYGLNATLLWPETEELLGEDLVFALRTLLIEPFGFNLRNQMAHGLVQDGGFWHGGSIYLWWLTLRLCTAPLTLLDQEARQSEDTSNPPSKNGE